MTRFVNHSISTHYAHATLKAAQRAGVDVVEMLQQAGVDAELLMHPNFRLTPMQFGRMSRLFWEQADDEFMGCTERPAKYGTFSLFAREAVRAQSLNEVYRHLCRFYRLVNEGIELKFDVQESEAVLSMRMRHPELDSDFLLRDFLLMLWHRFPAWLIGRNIPLHRVEMQGEKPTHSTEYRLLFPCPVIYEKPANRLIFDAQVLDRQIVQNLSNLKAHLRNAPLQWFTRQEYLPVFTRQVRRLLESPQGQHGDMRQIAKQLNMTTRTLRRKLEDEGTGFQQLKDTLRRDDAIHQLLQSKDTIQTIATELGFSETAAFTRAFKKWTGQTPKAFRKYLTDKVQQT